MLGTLSRRWDQLQRDARMIVAGFSAASAPRVVVIPQKRRRPLPGRGVEVVALQAETPDAFTIVLADPNGGAFPFEAGQFFTVVLSVGGEVVRRAYSASSDPAVSDRVALTIRRVPGGKASSALASLAPGAALRLLGPSGSFTLPADPALPMDVCFVAGGSGITPVMSILRTHARRHPTDVAHMPDGPRTQARRLHLVYGNRSPDQVIFRHELAALAKRGVVRVHHLLEEDAASLGGTPGLLDGEGLAAAFAALGVDVARTHFMASGPAGAVASVERALAAFGVPSSRTTFERFASVEARASGAALPVRATATFVGAAGARPVEVTRGETLLDAARRQGVDAPFSCTMGGCGACKLRVLAGEVTVDEPNCLLPAERAAGYVLGCVGRPLGDCTVEVPA